MADRGWPDDWTERMDGRECPICAAHPVKMNYMTLGNTVPHLHTHVVPRYRDDPAPGGPLAWEQIQPPEPVPEPDLRRQAADLRALLSR
jgi:diadenosine tetraphosphate (Ap4A) HIT family hydrolase